ncbi:glycerol-3-phosphate acyltransferase PlsY [Evansella vedderi]|uniref:Glycerol-3-phosphate acyltransferase n=1 Tax=Evansella vedderi TaxID=38282 RepID=A0ABU0A363_9BACI|nr:glycerol-3-phosphate 1-O-acyltransferase PlsY [Evansella vedderi]MDQ0256795.1 glycerol-3-phosphate acyltransferase PlsY [Evansella vedderi]
MIKLSSYYIILLAYIIGSIPFALIVGKLKYGADVRNFGSGNLGASNSALVLGKKAGALVLFGDVSKGALAMSLPIIFQAEVNPALLGMAVVLGHCFPIFAGFRGGKAVAPTAGALIFYSPLLFLVGYLTFFFVILLTKYVFMGSLSIGVVLTAYTAYTGEMAVALLFAAFSLFMVYLHRKNIINYFANKEVKITDKRIKDYQEKIKEELSRDIVKQDSGA